MYNVVQVNDVTVQVLSTIQYASPDTKMTTVTICVHVQCTPKQIDSCRNPTRRTETRGAKRCHSTGVRAAAILMCAGVLVAYVTLVMPARAVLPAVTDLRAVDALTQPARTLPLKPGGALELGRR